MMADPSIPMPGMNGAASPDTASAASPDAASAAGGDSDQGFTIEINVDSTGAITVELESSDQEASETDEGSDADAATGTPAKDINDALKIAKEMYQAQLNGGQSPQAMWNSEAATRGAATATS